ncbi:hypothetical protein [Microbacterium sp. NPDC086615]|uniref:hypothetical protein n=1 Tax=Microbacterium sp. NPDC086615 TaxID=3154865 RepID=UPI003427C896
MGQAEDAELVEACRLDVRSLLAGASVGDLLELNRVLAEVAVQAVPGIIWTAESTFNAIEQLVESVGDLETARPGVWAAKVLLGYSAAPREDDLVPAHQTPGFTVSMLRRDRIGGSRVAFSDSIDLRRAYVLPVFGLKDQGNLRSDRPPSKSVSRLLDGFTAELLDLVRRRAVDFAGQDDPVSPEEEHSDAPDDPTLSLLHASLEECDVTAESAPQPVPTSSHAGSTQDVDYVDLAFGPPPRSPGLIEKSKTAFSSYLRDRSNWPVLFLLVAAAVAFIWILLAGLLSGAGPEGAIDAGPVNSSGRAVTPSGSQSPSEYYYFPGMADWCEGSAMDQPRELHDSIDIFLVYDGDCPTPGLEVVDSKRPIGVWIRYINTSGVTLSDLRVRSTRPLSANVVGGPEFAKPFGTKVSELPAGQRDQSELFSDEGLAVEPLEPFAELSVFYRVDISDPEACGDLSYTFTTEFVGYPSSESTAAAVLKTGRTCH